MALNIPRRLGLQKPPRPKVDWTHPINRGLVACWPIIPNAAGGPKIDDIAGRRDFTVSSGGISDTKFGGTTIKFNGSTQFASTPAAKDKFANLGALTISLWVKHLAAQSGRMLNYGGSTALGGFTCTCNSTHDISFVHGFSSGLMARSTNNNTFTQNIWHHVVITWPGGLTAANVHTYIDTVEPGYRITTDGIGTQPDDSTAQLFMGAASAVPGNPINAAIENVRIFNRVITASEIKRLFQEPWVGIGDRSDGIFSHVGSSNTTTNITLGQATWLWTGQPPSINAKTQLTLAAANWLWGKQAPLVNAKTQITLAAANWLWTGVGILVNAKTQIALAAKSWLWGTQGPTVNAKTFILLANGTWIWTGVGIVLGNQTIVTLGQATWLWTGQGVLVNAKNFLQLASVNWLWRGQGIVIPGPAGANTTIMTNVKQFISGIWSGTSLGP